MNPSTSTYINIAIAVLGAVAAAGAYFTSMFGQQTAQMIVGTAGFVLAMLGAVNGAMHAVSTATPGPLAPPPTMQQANAVMDAARSAS